MKETSGKSILDVNIKNYGRIEIQLKAVMEKAGITRNRLCVLTDIKFGTVQKYYLGEVSRIDVDVLAKFCYALDCDVQDIVKYKQ